MDPRRRRDGGGVRSASGHGAGRGAGRRARQRRRRGGRGDARLRPLAGPYPSIAAVAAARGDGGDDLRVRVLASARAGDDEVGLVELATTTTAASCMVVAWRGDRVFAGPGFLCAAARSDEDVRTDAVAIATVDGELAIRFDVTYARDRAPASPAHHEIRCDVTARPPACTAPPAIGGYDLEE
ncbi:MAG: hypothetical protein H6708_19310 [Kofleriaceae bacterium]|nr:hypothetical protein [Kofleriaceae bacterium]